MTSDIKSSFRTLQVLEFFAHLQRPAKVREVHTALDMPQSSTSKLLSNLARRGYMEYDRASRTYFPTLRVSMLGNWLHERWFESRSLMAMAEDLRGRFGTSVILGAQNDTHVMYILALPAIIRPRPPLAMGALRPLCLTGVGKALMMLKCESETSLLIRRINSEAASPQHRLEVGAFLTEMRLSRERGYAMSHGEIVGGTGVVAVPLPPIPHQPQMALGLGATFDVLEERLEEMVTALAEKVRLLEQSAVQVAL